MRVIEDSVESKRLRGDEVVLQAKAGDAFVSADGVVWVRTYDGFVVFSPNGAFPFFNAYGPAETGSGRTETYRRVTIDTTVKYTVLP